MTGSILLEICVDTAEGLEIAAAHGADRIELCASLGIGGLTPSIGMMRLAKSIGFPTRAMIRPRQGDFTYSETELTMMLDDIDSVAAIGLEGVVVGANQLSGELDEPMLSRLVNHARAADLKVTLHRSFDLVPDPLVALNFAQSVAIDTLLTSGCAPSAIEGVDVIAKLMTYLQSHPATPRIEIMAGVGIHAQNVGEIVRNTGVRAVHGSCSKAATVTSGASDFGYADHRRTDRQRVTDLREALAPFHIVAAQ
ncbi:copper homeostasis protein CutC [Asticcacaulis benevestitus]|uniref:PF03932 family protein CutC n=1 Tax=Asticcacaulis benevestitus DSM 16100 = ATCC BAA-896 TaxID=1121022 RepID=V4PZ21_9CAUL|nr:copper homeostasis protein CutC [Asticcacaulis benevestitus]ESQ92664.1 hypothetical protein ABENE_07540 [Asticcacaulis benevestitus DSM 16100 = ATCC BAA-896]